MLTLTPAVTTIGLPPRRLMHSYTKMSMTFGYLVPRRSTLLLVQTRHLLCSLSLSSLSRLARPGAGTRWESRVRIINVSDLSFFSSSLPPLKLFRTYTTYQGWTTLVDWENAADDEIVRNVAISTSEKWKELGEKRGLYIDHLFMNDASRDQSPIATYGEASIAKLKAIALKYDPEQVFQNLQNDGFLLRKV